MSINTSRFGSCHVLLIVIPEHYLAWVRISQRLESLVPVFRVCLSHSKQIGKEGPIEVLGQAHPLLAKVIPTARRKVLPHAYRDTRQAHLYSE